MTNRSGPSRATRLRRLPTLFAMTALLIGVTPALAASQVTIEARALVGGRYEVGGWAAVAVTLVNEGAPTDGYLTAEAEDGVIRRFVEMPAGARKVVMLYVPPEAFQRRITVRYEEPNGTVEAAVEVRVFEQSSDQYAIVGDGAGTLRPQLATGDELGTPDPIGLSVADLPDRPEPLAGIAAIAWAADGTTVGEAQRRSLERWVADGGQLVVIGGPDWQSRTAAFSDLLPIEELQAQDGVPLEALAAWAGAAEPSSETATASVGTLRDDARALVTTDDGMVLASMRSVGAGRVVFLGTDFASDAYRGWEGSPRVWARLLPTGAIFEQFFGGGLPPQEAENAITQALGNIPSLEVPGAEVLLAVIVGYILLIGPISYIILRRMDRRELAWITAPLLVVLFTACSFGIGTSMKGSEVVVNEIALIRTSSAGESAMVESYAGIFSPDRSTYDLTMAGDALLAPVRATLFGEQRAVSPVVMEQGDPASVRELAIGVFGFEAVRADAIITAGPALEVTWREVDGVTVGTVTNVGDAPLTDVAYVSSSEGERIGDLEPGASADFEIDRTNINGSSASDQVYGFGGFDSSDADARRILMRRGVIDSLVGYGAFEPGGAVLSGGPGRGPYLIGWRDGGGPLPLEVEGVEAQRYSQSVEVLAVRPSIATGDVTFGPANMSISVIATDGDTGSAGPGMVTIGDGSATFSIALPLEANGIAVSSLEIVAGPDPSMVLSDPGGRGGFWPQGYSVEVRNPATGEWSLLGDLGDRSRFEVADPSTAIDASGRIEVRVRGDETIDPNFGQSSVFISAEVAGVITE
jgi:hypothetical protein